METELVWSELECTCTCPDCGDGIFECACETGVDPECDCSDAWIEVDREAGT